ncbi:uteroglobin [Tachyglossus aculeatus]|uniref:uteroglobin n=1 Tax=Tachyglossus aculeatus TaxID=9261 RepID=UPI0018F39AE5|nr:uteroglobin [Tachyglossus aculeatus]
MKLSLVAGLAILALCFSKGSGVVCPAVVEDLTLFLDGTPEEFQLFLQSFNATEDMIQAKLAEKECIDQMTESDRDLISTLMVNIVASDCLVKLD